MPEVFDISVNENDGLTATMDEFGKVTMKLTSYYSHQDIDIDPSDAIALAQWIVKNSPRNDNPS